MTLMMTKRKYSIVSLAASGMMKGAARALSVKMTAKERRKREEEKVRKLLKFVKDSRDLYKTYTALGWDFYGKGRPTAEGS
jgi:ribosomal protein L13E